VAREISEFPDDLVFNGHNRDTVSGSMDSKLFLMV